VWRARGLEYVIRFALTVQIYQKRPDIAPGLFT